MNVANLLERSAAACGGRPALAFGHRIEATYSEFHDRARRLAHGLRTRYAAGPGDRIALCCANHSSYLEAMYAAWIAHEAELRAELPARAVDELIDEARSVGARLARMRRVLVVAER